MGQFVNGVWEEQEDRFRAGRFQRTTTRYHNWITPDGSPGPSGEGGFAAERGRYHLYVALACPWAHRTIIFRTLKQLEEVISLSYVAPITGNLSWEFDDGDHADPLYGKARLGEVYLLADPRYTGRVSVPVLWDKKRRTIVNNESSEIIRMLNSAFGAFTGDRTDYYPPELRDEIDAVNEDVFQNVNNGVYRTGFAMTQEAYEEAFRDLFAALDRLEARLSRQRYLVGGRLTEADWRLFTTLIRFDAVYFGHFKCNWKRIVDYPNLSNYVRDLYQIPGIAELVDLGAFKLHYYASHARINPTRIVPLGPSLDFSAPHDRERFSKPAPAQASGRRRAGAG